MNELKGKKVLFLGDSITECVGASEYNKGYPYVFQRLTGATIFNFGISGSRIALQKIPSHWPRMDETFSMRADKMGDGDYVIVFGGSNDYGHGDAPFGEYSDETEWTFTGALRCLFKKLINKYPNSKIVVFTPLHRSDENTELNENSLPHRPLKDYVEMIKKMASEFNLPVFNLWDLYFVNPCDINMKEKYMPDGLHPNDLGHEILGKLVAEYIVNLE